MKALRSFLDKQAPHFHKGGKYERWFPLFEAVDTFLYSPGEVTRSGSHVRDGLDLKRMMLTVIFALQPVIIFSMYNQGYQANLAIAAGIAESASGWRAPLIGALGLGYNPASFIDCFVHGMIIFLPIFLVVQIAGGFWEVLFSIVRKHDVNEGFLVTGMLIPLIMPPNIPLWQVALGTSFGIVIGKEIFGGTGMNILNPALTARAFLFFSYPAQMSGDFVWTAVDGFSGATPLSQFAAYHGVQTALSQIAVFPSYAANFAGIDPWHGLDPWIRNFVGLNQGSFGETSTLMCLIGAAILIIAKIGSWRIMLGVVVGAFLTTLLFNGLAGQSSNGMFAIPFHWHLVIGGFAFGTVYMATDPVSASMTQTGRYIYGFLIGVMVVLIRVVNPAFPEGMMLAILFMNMFAPIIDHFVIAANIRKRRALVEG